MFQKVLIANRGEIACRAIRTLRKMQLSSLCVYATADASSLHVREADEAVRLSGNVVRETYLDVEQLLAIAERQGAGAVFPGYGFLSENAEFADRCAERGLVFIGPSSEHIRAFGLKHRARELAATASVPLLPGTELLRDREAALEAARNMGYPVMLKSTGGGGGIGLTVCARESELREVFDSAVRLAQNHFAEGGVFLERYVARARHLEVQIFGDGRGAVMALGERDCSAQRRHQKVLEETPAPNLPDAVRRGLADAAVRLMRQASYRSAGTVEFIYDVDREEYYFLEVNTRLQVEHGVTERVTGIDLVEWMVETARGNPPDLSRQIPARGHAIEARVYAEAPAKDFRPSAGLLTRVQFPEGVDGIRIDGWIETGVEVSPHYDPMLAKVIASGATRDEAITMLRSALAATRIDGIQTNVEYLSEIVSGETFARGEVTTGTLRTLSTVPRGIEVLRSGTFSTLQDYPGRVGYWNVGIPPSGPMDALSLRLGNRLLGNPEGATALEMTLLGSCLRFSEPGWVCLTGAELEATLDGVPVARYRPFRVAAGQALDVGKVKGPGARAYLCVRGGFDVPEYLGSRSTFTLGRFGGHAGRVLEPGDVLQIHESDLEDAAAPSALRPEHWPELGDEWRLRVMYGPHGAPDFFTERDVQTFFETAYEVHYNSARTGVRLVGPKPEWARADGGEAGLHPSNIHDTAYAFGTVDFTGDMPIILGPDGPSLGGFVCPATVITADLWKLGQLAPGARVRFVPVSEAQASALEREQNTWLQRSFGPEASADGGVSESPEWCRPIEAARPSLEALGSARITTAVADAERPEVNYRAAGDHFLLVEYGPMVLDFALRFRVHALAEWIAQHVPAQVGIIETTPGIRSLQIHYDNQRLPRERLLALLEQAERELPDTSTLRVPARIVHLPLSWDDEATQLAVRKYTQLVRKDAPWAPSNIEFIRRINGLDDVEDVQRILFSASYLVLGLGDVYLGAPVATPIDPRHRLVTTKYNPARTWTPENAVGIGGAYLCIYGMEGPGGYQLVGRTLQMFNRFRVTRDFEVGKPWLLRFFDQIRFFPVSGGELLELRDAFAAGRYPLRIEPTTFDLGEYQRSLQAEADDIARFKQRQSAAFAAERQRWLENGQHQFTSDADFGAEPVEVPEGCQPVGAPVPGSVWKVLVEVGVRVELEQKLVILESMKMEMSVEAPAAGIVRDVRVQEGNQVSAGQILIVIEA